MNNETFCVYCRTTSQTSLLKLECCSTSICTRCLDTYCEYVSGVLGDPLCPKCSVLIN